MSTVSRAPIGTRAAVLVAALCLLAAAVAWAQTLTAPGAAAPPAQGNAPAPASAAPGSDPLRERAAEFWAARVAGDVDAQWRLLEPRGRGRLTPNEYAGGPGAVKYLAYQIEDAKVDGFFAVVKVRILVQPMLSGVAKRPVAPAATMVDDRWIRIRGVWYRSLDQEEQPQGPQQAGKG